jgi:hypothetical protein
MPLNLLPKWEFTVFHMHTTQGCFTNNFNLPGTGRESSGSLPCAEAENSLRDERNSLRKGRSGSIESLILLSKPEDPLK